MRPWLRVWQKMIEEKLGRYSIVKTIGSGSMGTVYKAEDRKNRSPVAVKLIRSQVLYNIHIRERFLQNVLAASEIKHKGVCPILEIGDDDDDFYVITPFLEGVTLQRRLDGRPMPLMEALRVATEVAEALAAIHAAGFAHRGLNPANIWLRPDGSVLVTDCGLARFMETDQRKQPLLGAVETAGTLLPVSTWNHMSPEQIRGLPVDYRTDVFSWGVLLYEMLTGSHPFDAPTSLAGMNAILEATPQPANSRVAGLPPPVDGILARAMEKAPEDRYQSVAELLDELSQLCKAAPGQAKDAGRNPIFPRPVRVAAGALLLAILAILVYYFLVH